MASWADGAVDELIAAAGGDHVTISAFEAAHDGEAPTNGTTCQGRVKGGGGVGSATVYWIGWQAGMNATTKIVIVAESGSETDGTDGGGDDAIVTGQQRLYEGTNDFYLDWSGIEHSNSMRNQFDGGGIVNIAKCMFRDIATSPIDMASMSGAGTVNVGGCLFKDSATDRYAAATRINDAQCTSQIYNITAARVGTDGQNGYGIWGQNGTVTTKNCAIYGSNNSDFLSIDTEDYCASEDATAAGGNSVTGLTDADADDFTEPSTDDFTVYAAGGSILEAAGVAIADGWFTTLCATDLNGNAWESPPSIGCYEVIGGGVTQDPSGILPAMAGVVTRQKSFNRAIGGSI